MGYVRQSSSRFNTSAWVAGQVVKVPLFPSGSLDAAATHAVTISKDTEPGGQMNHSSGVMVSNYITFHGFSAVLRRHDAAAATGSFARVLHA